MRPLKIFNGIVTNNDDNTEMIDSTSTSITLATSDAVIFLINSEKLGQDHRLVWLDSHVNETNNDHITNTSLQLRQIMNSLKKFTDIDQCIEFIQTIKEEKVFMICSEELGQTIVPVVHPLIQIDAIYIFCKNEQWYANWTKDYFKIKGIFTDIALICEALKDAITDYEHNTVSFSLVNTTDESTKPNLDSLDKSFMYTQILKEILLTIDFELKHINEFLVYCRELFIDNLTELRRIDKIEMEYHTYEPIWWYTYQSFLYPMLNRALRLMEVDVIIKMGFFLKDVHNHLVKLHSEQFSIDHDSNSLTVYRGQGFSQTDFDNLQQTQGGLLSFNNFLSTSTNLNVSLRFARRTISSNPDLIGVLFVMQINPTISTTPFANVKDVSYFQGEDEILFSMHSIFRIGQIQQIDGNARLWQVDLALTSDNDPQLYALTERIREETFPNHQGWYRLGNLLIKLGQFDKAQQVFDILLEQTTDEREDGKIYHTVGLIKYNQGKYENAAEYYEQSIRIYEKCPSLTNLDLAVSYSNLGSVYDQMGEYSKAISYYEKGLEILKRALPANHSDLANSYNNIGAAFHNMGKYSEALSYYKKARDIFKKILPENHPSFSSSYSNIAAVYKQMGEYSTALSYLAKALEISEKTLPENHPDLAKFYNNIGAAYDDVGEYSKALSSYEKALEIRLKTLSENHPLLAISYNNLAHVYTKIGEYAKVFSSYEKSLEILRRSLPVNHPLFATSYNNVGQVLILVGEYSTALSYFEKSHEILKETLPETHPHLAGSCNNIAWVYRNMNDYGRALQYYERALDIWLCSLPSNHLYIKDVKDSIEFVKNKL